MNKEIEQIFKNFDIPVSFMKDDTHGESYATYGLMMNDNIFSADDELQNYVVYYDIDVYSKKNFIKLLDKIIEKMENSGWKWQPAMSSADMYENDTGYFHRTLCFSKEKGI